MTTYEKQREYKKNHPWLSHYSSARERCKLNGVYGKKGIRFLMTIEDFKYLWFRDKAFEMVKPSIDREDTKGNYELSNCRFMEYEINIRRQKNVAWLKWGSCIQCHKTDRKHVTNGICDRCFQINKRNEKRGKCPNCNDYTLKIIVPKLRKYQCLICGYIIIRNENMRNY